MRFIVATLAALAAFFVSIAQPEAQTKRIKDLTPATSTTTGDIVPIDGTTLRGITVENFLKPSLVAIKALTPAADKCIVFTSGTVAALADCPSFGRSLLAAASSAATKTLLSLENVDNTSDTTKNAASVTLTNKTISGASNTLSSIALSSHSTQAAYSFVGNNTGSAAAPAAVTISGLTSKASPVTNDLVIIEDSAASFAWKKATVGSISAAGSVASIAGNTGAFTLANGIDNSTNQIQLTAARRTLPTTQAFLSGSGTYTTPANVLWIEIRLVGGGGGGAGSGSGPGGAGAGGDTCWNTSGAACTTPVYSAGGGVAGSAAGSSVAGGAVTGSSTCSFPVAGGIGGPANATTNAAGGIGGGTSLSGSVGAFSIGTSAGVTGSANTGVGGSGAASGGTGVAGGGGGGGATCYTILNSPGASYTYAVGAAGTAGTAGASGSNGGAGTAGRILVIEHYGT